MKKQKILYVSLIILCLQNSAVLAQSSTAEMQTQIDSLKATESKLENQLAIVRERIKILHARITEQGLQGVEALSALVSTPSGILKEPHVLSSRMGKIERGDTVEVIGYDVNKFYKIRYKGLIGYIPRLSINDTDELLLLQKKAAQAQLDKKDMNAIKMRREKERTLKQRYGEKIASKILAERIWIGMTKEMTIDSWGEPHKINRTVTSDIIHEQWIYGNAYLYFDNGILKSFQDEIQ